MTREKFFSFTGLAVCLLFVSACSSVRIPTVPDYVLERRVAEEIAPIIQVTKDRDQLANYRIQLADFPRKDILGMSVGKRRIYVSYDLAHAAYKNDASRWLLRQILAHEVAHELSGHADGGNTAAYDRAPQGVITAEDIGLPTGVRFQNYSLEKELEADRVGMEYWQKLNWDYRIWVGILQRFKNKKYDGDAFHPTDERLRQAAGACPQAPSVASGVKSTAPVSQKSASK